MVAEGIKVTDMYVCSHQASISLLLLFSFSMWLRFFPILNAKYIMNGPIRMP